MNSPALFASATTFFKDTDSLNSLFGAGLGVSFYILIKTQKYLLDRSFDPKYTNAYLTRFATGIVSGFILSNVIGFILGTKSSATSAFAQLTPGVIAILGGFSAEAVEQILQRMVEVLLTLVRGDGSAQAKADQAVLQAKNTEEQSKRNSTLREKLAELPNLSADPANLKQAVEAIRSLLK